MTVTLNRGSTVVVFKEVPAQVCSNCGEYYLSEEVSKKLLTRANAAVAAGAEVEIIVARSRSYPCPSLLPEEVGKDNFTRRKHRRAALQSIEAEDRRWPRP